MRLQEVTLTNFRSYKGLHTFRPRPGTTFLLGSNSDDGYSSNGGGKTSLLSSIAWALYGELATGASKDAVIHYGEPEVFVEVKFDGLTIRRGKKRAKPEQLEFFVDEWGEWIKEDLAETQEKLDKYLGVGKDLFYNAFWLDNASKTVQFLFKRPAERLQALQDLLGEGFFSQAKKAATVLRSEAETSMKNAEYALSVLDKQEVMMVSRILDLEMQLQRETERINNATEDRRNNLETLRCQVNTIQSNIEVLTSKRDQVANGIKISPEELIRNCALLEAQQTQLEVRFQKATVGKKDEPCPTCLRTFESGDKERIESERKKIYSEIDRVRRALAVEQKKKDELLKERKKVDKMSEEIVQLRAVLNGQKGVLEREADALEGMDVTILDRLKEMINKDRKSLDGVRVDMEKERGVIRSKKVLVPRYRFWEEGFGSKGIQNLLLDDIRVLLDQFTRNYLSHFSGEVLRVVYPKSDKGFEINVSYRDKETPVSNLSRGEVGRANMAVLLALRKMLLFMHKSRVDFIVLDDAISDLDESGTQSIVDLSEALSKEVGNVFLTIPQHIPGIKTESIVRVEKKDGESKIS